jgi:hypothetical protein
MFNTQPLFQIRLSILLSVLSRMYITRKYDRRLIYVKELEMELSKKVVAPLLSYRTSSF